MGLEVTVVEMLDEIAKEESSTVKPTMFEDFKAHNVQLLTKTKVTAITPSSVEAQNEEDIKRQQRSFV